MVDVSLRRRIVLLVPASVRDGVLAHGTDLPAIDCTLAAGENTIEAVARILPTVGLGGPVLDCVVDQTDPDEIGSQPRSVLVELGPPPLDWTMPPEWAWLPWDELDTKSAPALEVVTTTRIAELRGHSSVPEERAAWTRLGWYERATEWIERSLASAGRAAPHAMVQVRHWGISALIRVDAPDGRTWFKASFPPFHNEAPISALLAELAPGQTCGVVAADASSGWLLLDDFDGTTDATDPETTRLAVDHLVRLQRKMGAHQLALRSAGCEHRPLGGLAAELKTALDSDVATVQLGLSTERVSELFDAVTVAAAAIESVGLPETLLHGDFHPGNIAVTDAGMVLFDWSDGAIGNPVIDIATWGWWYDDDEPRLAELWGLFCSAWQREFGIDLSGLRREDVDVVAGAFHLVSYVRILSALEPTDRPSHAGGLDHFFALLTSGLTRRWS